MEEHIVPYGWNNLSVEEQAVYYGWKIKCVEEHTALWIKQF